MSLIFRLVVCAMVVALAIDGVVSPAAAAPRQWTVSQRDVSAQVSLVDGVLRVGVSRLGRTVLAPAPVGLRTDGADLSTGLTVVGQERRTVVDRYEMTTGKRHLRQNRFSELRLALRNTTGARLDVVVRAAADGVAYRYELPAAATITDWGDMATLTPVPSCGP